jgi:hypothetical protein
MYWLVIYPVDQVKSAIMCDSLNPSERVYPNMSTAFRVGDCLGLFWGFVRVRADCMHVHAATRR